MSANAKLGTGVLAIVLLCLGLAMWQLGGDNGSGAPPGEEDRRTARLDRDGPGGMPEADGEAGPEPVAQPGTTRGPDTDDAGGGSANASPGGGNVAAGSGTTPEPGKPVRGPPEPGELRGRLRAGGTDNPVPGATVILVYDLFLNGGKLPEGGVPRYTTTSDENGEYRFEDVQPGVYRVVFSHPRFAHRSLKPMRIQGGDGPIEIAVPLVGALETLGAIEGWVTRPDTTPFAGARIVVHAHEDAVMVETTTDEDGRYFVDRLVAGHYRVSLLTEAKGDVKPTGSGLWERVQFASVSPQKTVRLDFRGTGVLSGVVRDHEGAALAGVSVKVIPLDYTEGYRVRAADTDEDGRFSIENAGLGWHRIRIQDAGGHWSTEVTRVNLSGYDQEQDVNLAVGVVGGLILLAEDNTPPMKSRLYPGLMLLAPWEGREGMYRDTVANTWPDEKGRFAFRGIAAGKYRLWVRLDGFHLIEQDIEVRDGVAFPDLRLSLRRFRTGQVRVRVTDRNGNPAEGILFRYQGSDGKWTSVRARREGPGLYLLETVEIGTRKLLASREDLARRIVTVEVAGEEAAEVAMTLQPKN